ncbi:MAG: hypothetical protein ACRD1Y_09160 [Terriglobales bacterium]
MKEARALLQSAASDAGNDHNAMLLAYLGHLQALFGDIQAAQKLTGEAVHLDPDCASCHLYRFEAIARRAETLSQLKAMLKLHSIKKQLEQAEKLNPRLGDIQWGWIQMDLNLPAALGGSAANALKHAAILSQIDPVDGHLARAKIYQWQGQLDQVLNEYRAAAHDYPGDPRGIFALGRALYQRADYAAAAAPLRRAWEMNRASVLYGAYHAANLVQLQRSRRARTVLQAARLQHPDSRLGDFLTAQALLHTGQDPAWAGQLLERYLAVPPEPGQATTAQARQLLAQSQSHAAAAGS